VELLDPEFLSDEIEQFMLATCPRQGYRMKPQGLQREQCHCPFSCVDCPRAGDGLK
jgi:hypothetical protein